MAYSYTPYETAMTSDNSGGGLGVWIIMVLAYSALIILLFASAWKVFAKAKQPGWASLIPIYSTVVLLRIIGRPLWWFFLMLVPIVSIVVVVLVYNDLAKSFGKGTGWTVGLLLLPVIFMPMLAFGSAKYVGPAALKGMKSK